MAEENTYELNVLKPTNSQGTSIRTDVGPSDDKSTALQIPEKGIEFKLNVKPAGYYNLLTDYYPTDR